jgi:hypothetical protein
MKKLSLIEKIEIYDKILDRVLDELKLEKPSWEVKWFYRFLVINPAANLYVYLNNNVSNKEYSGDPKYKIYYEKGLLRSGLVVSLHNLWDFKYTNLIRWWFKQAQPLIAYSIKEVERYTFEQHADQYKNSDGSKPTKEQLLDEWIDTQKSGFEIYDLKYKAQTGQYAIFAIPHNGNRREIEHYIKEFFKNEFIDNTLIVKSKMSERTIKDIFRVFEYRAKTGETDLIEIAKNSGALKISTANMGTNTSTDSLQSVRAGMHRLFDIGLMIIRNTSYAKFPSIKKLRDYDFESGVDFVMDNYFDIEPERFFKRLEDDLPSVEDMESVIREDIRKCLAWEY